MYGNIFTQLIENRWEYPYLSYRGANETQKTSKLKKQNKKQINKTDG